MTLEQLIEQQKQRMNALLEQRNKHKKAIDDLRAATSGDTEREPTADESTVAREAAAQIATIDTQLAELRARVTDLEGELARDVAAQELQRQIGETTTRRPAYDEVINRGDTNEPRTYTREKSRSGEARWITDAWNSKRGNRQAEERLNRHGAEVEVHGEITQRALATGGIAGLTPPQYLVDLAAPVLRAGRPFANITHRHEMPEIGMTLYVPRGTTGASAAAQASENSAVNSTDQIWANVAVPVCTVAGQIPVSRQVLERGEAMDEILFLDLVRAYHAQVDNYCLNGTGSSGQPLGALNTSGISAATAFGAAVTPANLNSKIAGQITAVTSAGAGLTPNALVMHPRRWGAMTAMVDSSNRPIVTANQVNPMNALAVIEAPGQIGAGTDAVNGAMWVGTHVSGLPVITDLNIPTNVGTNSEDLILAVATAEHHLWEDGDGMPKQLTFEQTLGGQLTTTLVAYSYIAYTAGRYPLATGKVGGLDTAAGNGLVTPAF